MDLAVNNPNLSVIMPVGCNAKCGFCYWKASRGLTKGRFQFIANNLSENFRQISITGGEPTLCNDLDSFLAIARSRFEKVVLNTNGYNLQRKHFSFVDHVNISRHHYDENENRKVFNTDSVPNAFRLKELCGYGDVTLNCVLPEGFSDKEFIRNYILFAKACGARVAFRKYFNNLNILGAIDTDDTLVSEHKCGACCHRIHNIEGVKVTFKYSVQETSEHVNGIYELVLQSNGNLTFDWAGKNKVLIGGEKIKYNDPLTVWKFDGNHAELEDTENYSRPSVLQNVKKIEKRRYTSFPSMAYSSGCGGSSYSSGWGC